MDYDRGMCFECICFSLFTVVDMTARHGQDSIGRVTVRKTKTEPHLFIELEPTTLCSGVTIGFGHRCQAV